MTPQRSLVELAHLDGPARRYQAHCPLVRAASPALRRRIGVVAVAKVRMNDRRQADPAQTV